MYIINRSLHMVNRKFRLLSAIKQCIIPRGRSVRTIKTGAFHGLRMCLDLTSQSQMYLGIAEREVHRWLKQASKDINTAIDIGAAEGEYALYFLANTMAHRVIIVEPDRQSHALLTENLRLNGFGASERAPIIATYVANDMFALDQLESVITLPCCVKIDVDGGETSILRSATQLLMMPQMRWLIETHSVELEKECSEILASFGYRTTIIPNAFWRLVVPELRVSPQNRWLVARRDCES